MLLGENFLISSSVVVVMAKLASNFLSSAPPAVPVVMISSMYSSLLSSAPCAMAWPPEVTASTAANVAPMVTINGLCVLMIMSPPCLLEVGK